MRSGTVTKYLMILNRFKLLSDRNELTRMAEILTELKASQAIPSRLIELGYFKPDPNKAGYFKSTLVNGFNSDYEARHALKLAESCVIYGREHTKPKTAEPVKQPEQLEAITSGFDRYTTDQVIQILKNHKEIEITGQIFIRKEIHL